MPYDERTFWLQEEDSFSSQRVRSALSDVVFLGLLVVVVTGFWLWGPKISVVLSQSMNPTYKAGDALIVVPWATPRIGDIAQFTVELAPGQAETTVPVTHRIIGQDDRGFITKGDNPKSTPDVWRVTPDMIEGKVVFWMPRVWMFRLASILIGIAILMFLWPRPDAQVAVEHTPVDPWRALAGSAPVATDLPVSCHPQPQGPPVALPPLRLPRGMSVALPPPGTHERGVL